MGIIELLGLAGSISLLSGWRLYLTVFAVGLARYMNWIDLPDNLAILNVLANPWVMGVAAIGAIAEFFADKVAWLDSVWDTVHTVVRPVGGALLAMSVVSAQDPAWQVIAFLLGGGAALLSHGAKAGTRAVVNASPEPFSNIAVSAGEDVATTGLLVLALANPVAAVIIAVVMLIAVLVVLYYLRRLLKKLFGDSRRPPQPYPDA
ncbi:DUF4126 domain-containing protein [Pseudonocardia sp. TMWB2A]|uniref:DUF4126 domain-containing protein n=1 Tax=Pseudonocardia sp. TMWB2A TaxID=687430 RepID=UPI00307D638B